MKKLKQFLMLAVIVTALSFASCKSKNKGDNNAPATTTADTSMSSTPAPEQPVTVSSDDALKTGVTDALKDYPSVKGEVSDSVIVLTGSIKRSDWQKLMPTLNSLHPKHVNSNNLTIK
jgi:hypothetical protein